MVCSKSRNRSHIAYLFMHEMAHRVCVLPEPHALQFAWHRKLINSRATATSEDFQILCAECVRVNVFCFPWCILQFPRFIVGTRKLCLAHTTHGLWVLHLIKNLMNLLSYDHSGKQVRVASEGDRAKVKSPSVCVCLRHSPHQLYTHTSVETYQVGTAILAMAKFCTPVQWQ